MPYDYWNPPPTHQIEWLAQHYGLPRAVVWDLRHAARNHPCGADQQTKYGFWLRLNNAIRDYLCEHGLWGTWFLDRLAVKGENDD